MQETALRAPADAGLDEAAFHAMGRFWLIRGHEIEYLHPVRGGERIEIKTWNLGVRRTFGHSLL